MRCKFVTLSVMAVLMFAKSPVFAGSPSHVEISPELHDFYIAKMMSSLMSLEQITDCAALNETSAEFYRDMELEGEFPVETIRKVERRGQDFWVTTYGLASGKTASYEDIINLSHYLEEYRVQEMKGNAPSLEFSRAVTRCADQKRRAAHIVNKKNESWGFSDERVDSE